MLAIVYLLISILLGDSIARRFLTLESIQHRWSVAFFTGLLLSTCATYILALCFSFLAQPLLPANILFLLFAAGVVFWLRRSGLVDRSTDNSETHQYRELKWDWVTLSFCLTASFVLFSNLTSADGSFVFAQRSLNDFGPSLSLSQSLSLGGNFPTEHPMASGEPIRYHFLFWFQAANLSYLGLNLALSVNLLSILSLVALLVLIMTFATTLFNSKAVGRLSCVLFFFASSSLAYIPFIASKSGISELWTAVTGMRSFLESGYKYWGEGWGSLGVTIFAYQRHLVSGVGILFVVLVFLIGFYRRRGVIVGPSWHARNVDDRNEISAEVNDQGVEEERGANQFDQNEVPDADPLMSVDLADEIGPDLDDPGDIEDPGSTSLDLKATVSSGDDSEASLRTHVTTTTSESRRAGQRDNFALVFCGILLGALPYWNSAVYVSAFILIGGLFVFFPYRRSLLFLIAPMVIIGMPQVAYMTAGHFHPSDQPFLHLGYTVSEPTVTRVLEYLAWTFGFKWPLLLLALWFLPGSHRRLFIVFSALLAVAFMFRLSADIFNNHKLLNLWNIFAAIYVAYILWVIGRASFYRFVLAFVLAVLMTFGALIDLFPFFNDSSATIRYTGDSLTDWIENNTRPDDRFVTFPSLADPILFSGHKVFMGHQYFLWSAGYNVEERERGFKSFFYEQNFARLVQNLSDNKISYVAIDDNLRSYDLIKGFDESIYERNFEVSFRDPGKRNLTIYKVPAEMPVSSDDHSNPTEEHERSSTSPASNIFTGVPGSGLGQLLGPRGVATDSGGLIYVADTGNSRIQKFNPNGTLVSTIGSPGTGRGELKEPNGIAIDADGNIFVTDALNHKLVKYLPDESFAQEWLNEANRFYGPRDIALGPDKMLYIVDQGRTRIAKFDPSTERFSFWGVSGSGEGQFKEATGIVISDSMVYVADFGNQRIQGFDLAGNFIKQWPVAEWDPTSNHYPDIAYDFETKRLFVTSAKTNQVLTFDVDGNRLDGPVVGNAELSNPSSLIVTELNGSRRLLVLNTGGAKITALRLHETGVK